MHSNKPPHLTRSQKLARLRLIAITDTHITPWPELESCAQTALEAGLPALMIRDKGMSDEALLPIARRLREATRRTGALLIINRRLELARQVEADGVQIGITGPRIHEVREQVGESMLIGYSAHNHNEALRAFSAGADYVFYSPIFDTPSKRGILDPLGLETLEKLTWQSPGPVLALGGIGPDQIEAVINTGAHGIAGIRLVFGTDNPANAVRSMLEHLPPIDS